MGFWVVLGDARGIHDGNWCLDERVSALQVPMAMVLGMITPSPVWAAG